MFRLGVATEHRLREHELSVDVHVEDASGSGDDLEAPDDVREAVEQRGRQTGGLRQRPSRDAVLDPDRVGRVHYHAGILPCQGAGAPFTCA